MKCKNLRIRTEKGKKYGLCLLKNTRVSVFCNKCSFEVKYNLEKINKSDKKVKIANPIKRRSNKLIQAEKKRYSIIYQDLTKCCVEGCQTPYCGVQKNEVFEGAYRQVSMKHGMVCPLCFLHHKQFHEDREFALYYKRMFQDKFVESHSLEEFIEIFKQNYHYTS